MADAAARRLVVGRVRKPHGLKGEVVLFPLTDRPDEVFVAGREVEVVDLAGAVVAGPLTIERTRPYHRDWLVKFEGLEDRSALEALPALRGKLLAVPSAELPPPEPDEFYHHELVGMSVRLEDGTGVGLVSQALEMPSGLTLEVQGPKREFLLPFIEEFVTEVDREARAIVIRPPDGLMELE